MTFEFCHQSALLQSACRRLALNPQDQAIRRDMVRAIAMAPLAPVGGHTTPLRFLAAEAREHADGLAFRLESRGCNRLAVCVATAGLSQALALLQGQLRQEAGLGNFDLLL